MAHSIDTLTAAPVFSLQSLIKGAKALWQRRRAADQAAAKELAHMAPWQRDDLFGTDTKALDAALALAKAQDGIEAVRTLTHVAPPSQTRQPTSHPRSLQRGRHSGWI